MSNLAPTLNPPNLEDDYVDNKRYAWLVSLLVPLMAAVGPYAWLVTKSAWTLIIPLIFSYLAIPVLDLLLGLDRSNPPESAVPRLEADLYYRAITFLLVPLLWCSYLFGAWFSSQHNLPWYCQLAVFLSYGISGGFMMNLAHELGHKHSRFERALAMITLVPTAYGHFCIEHNRGHHRDVSTPEDSASSRMGESIYRFALREVPGAVTRAWSCEARRLKREGRSVLSIHNEFLQPIFLTLALWAAMILWLGWSVVPFIVGVSVYTHWQLTSANYVEHYGLLRQKIDGNRYERCQPHHSWNSNHVFSNWGTFHLQRHSDHHAHPARRYQSLRHFDEAPQLPTGYSGMFLLAYVPFLWFRVMNPRLLAAVNREPERINFDPSYKTALMTRYGLSWPTEACRDGEMKAHGGSMGPMSQETMISAGPVMGHQIRR